MTPHLVQTFAMAFPRIAIPSRPPAVIAVLLLTAIVFFVGITQVAQAFRRYETRLGESLYAQGEAEMRAAHADRAISDFRAALSFRRDSREYQLSLARALRDTGRLEESESYLQRLWEQHPDDSEVNLALGRLAVKRGALPDVLRYYHNAIYGAWPSDPDNRRREARLELTHLLVQEHAYTQAQSELIALTPQAPDDPDLHIRVAQMFYDAQDYQHAFDEYLKVLRLRRANVVAQAGAGRSAFQMGRYRTAAEYATQAVRGTSDPDLQNLLAASGMVLQLDPYARRISDAERASRLRAALQIAGRRLSSCMQSGAIPGGSEIENQWRQLQREMKLRRTGETSDLADQVMNFVIEIEKEPCGPPTLEERALMMVARNPTGADR